MQLSPQKVQLKYNPEVKKIYDTLEDKNWRLTYRTLQTNGQKELRFEIKKDKIIKEEEKIRYITKDEFDKFISVVDIPLWHTFFITLYYTGARIGEILALNWNDVVFNSSEIKINKTLYSIKSEYTITSTKNNKNRIIKMSKILKKELYSYYQEQIKYTDFNKDWFIFGGSIHLPLTTINRYKHKYFVESGVHEITLHEFRHSHISLLINEYIKSGQTDTTKFFLMLSSRMGHTVGVMQKTYMHLFPTSQDTIVELLDNL